MLVVMKQSATAADIDRVCNWIKEKGYTAQPMPGEQRTAIGLVGNDGRVDDTNVVGSRRRRRRSSTSPIRTSRSRASGSPENTLVTIAPASSSVAPRS
jgi:3-deoxy-7-phosphoheptulonate synthase